MVHATAQKPGSLNKGGRDMAQRLVEIGAVLFTYRKQATGGDSRRCFRGQRIEITDHRIRHMPVIKRGPRPAIRRDKRRAVLARQIDIARINLPAPNQGNHTRSGNNICFFAHIVSQIGSWPHSGHEMILSFAQIRAEIDATPMVNG